MTCFKNTLRPSLAPNTTPGGYRDSTFPAALPDRARRPPVGRWIRVVHLDPVAAPPDRVTPPVAGSVRTTEGLPAERFLAGAPCVVGDETNARQLNDNGCMTSPFVTI